MTLHWRGASALAVMVLAFPLAAQNPTGMAAMGPPALALIDSRGAPPAAAASGSTLRRELARYHDFRLLDSAVTAEAFVMARGSRKDCSDFPCLQMLGKNLGARWVATAEVGQGRDQTWRLSGRLMDVESGRLVTDDSIPLTAPTGDAASAAAADLSRRFARATGATPLAEPATSRAADQGALTREAVLARLAGAAGSEVPDLSGLDLRRLDLSGIDFRSANLTKARLDSANLSDAKLFAVDLTDAVAAGADFRDANLDGSTLRRADLRGANLHGASMFATIVEAADLSETDLGETRIIGYLRAAKLRGANLRGANIGADAGNQSMGVMRATFVGADLSGADLTGANLFKADFSYARLIGAILVNTDLRNAELIQADLTEADVTGANVAAADLNGTIFTKTKGVATLKGLEQARNRDKAVMNETN